MILRLVLNGMLKNSECCARDARGLVLFARHASLASEKTVAGHQASGLMSQLRLSAASRIVFGINTAARLAAHKKKLILVSHHWIRIKTRIKNKLFILQP